MQTKPSTHLTYWLTCKRKCNSFFYLQFFVIPKIDVDMFICGKFVWRETTLNRGIIGRFINEKTRKRNKPQQQTSVKTIRKTTEKNKICNNHCRLTQAVSNNQNDCSKPHIQFLHKINSTQRLNQHNKQTENKTFFSKSTQKNNNKNKL